MQGGVTHPSNGYPGRGTHRRWVQAYSWYAEASAQAHGVLARRMGTHQNGYLADGSFSAACYVPTTRGAVSRRSSAIADSAAM